MRKSARRWLGVAASAGLMVLSAADPGFAATVPEKAAVERVVAGFAGRAGTAMTRPAPR
ncbi:ATP-dependent protease ClpP protease subunit [Planotetraspora sp. GP83]